MQVTVTFRHVESSEPLREYALDKVTRLTDKYLKRAIDAHVILTVNKRRHLAEININAPHFVVSAHESTEDLYSAIDLAIDKVQAQARRHKDRLNHHKGSSRGGQVPADLPVEVIDAGDFENSGVPRVIEIDSMPAKPLDLDEAIVQLELRDSEFLVFRNSDTQAVNVLYRRRDGNFGLISPNT